MLSCIGEVVRAGGWVKVVEKRKGEHKGDGHESIATHITNSKMESRFLLFRM